jgi:hypothetical protein
MAEAGGSAVSKPKRQVESGRKMPLARVVSNARESAYPTQGVHGVFAPFLRLLSRAQSDLQHGSWRFEPARHHFTSKSIKTLGRVGQ